jgi:hypothetical protein
MRKRGAESGDGRPARMLITHASGRGRRLFTRRPSRWAGLLIWTAVVVGAVCLIAKVASGRDPVNALAYGCAVVAATVLASGLLLRVLASRT